MKQPLLNASLMASAIILGFWCHSEPVGAVTLTLADDNTNAIVSWPYPSTGFGLEFSTNLSTTNWQPAAGTSVSNSGRWAVTTQVNLPNLFFRSNNHLQHFGFWAASDAAFGSLIEQSCF